MNNLFRGGKRLKIILLVTAILVSGIGSYFGVGTKSVTQASTPSNGAAVIEQAFVQQQSKVWVQVEASVSKLLRDDLDGSKHQRFIINLDNEHTVLVAHNIDLAPRVPVTHNDNVSIRGRYEWNNKGGVLHWTHHDPKKRIQGGWIDFNGKRYE